MRTKAVGLHGWATFEKLVESRGWRWDDPPIQKLSQANARIRMARHLSVSFGTALNDETSEGYHAIVRAAMSYSALDVLTKGVANHSDTINGFHARDISIPSQACAEAFREPACKRFRAALDNDLSSPLRQKMADLAEAGENVGPLAQGVRHLAFHGVFTPATIGYTNGKDEPVNIVLSTLHQEVLHAADKYFDWWVKERESSP